MKFEILKNEVNQYLTTYFQDKNDYNKLIYEAMAYSINVGGKRIRPILMLLTYSMYKSNYKNILPMACAVEMIHTYSLIHDDLPCMDNDDLRRGMPSNHKKFGEGVAVLAGDALLNEAFNVMLSCDIEHSVKIETMKILSYSSSAEGMIGGQIVDILSENRSISEKELYYMHSKKTGELIRSSIVCGAILGGASKEEIKILDEYGKKLGLVFQIKDDILDVEGDKEKLGKNVNVDSDNDKTTFVTLYGIEQCKRMAKNITDECFKLLYSLDRETKELEDITSFLLLRDY